MRAIIMIVTDNKQLHLQILNKIMSEKQLSQLQKTKTIFFLRTVLKNNNNKR
jgi:hypothetical protein